MERFLYAAKGLQSDAGTPENHRITVIVCNPQTREAAVATAAGGGFMGLPCPFCWQGFEDEIEPGGHLGWHTDATALMVAQSAADPAGAAFDAAGKPARYKNFHFTVHTDARV